MAEAFPTLAGLSKAVKPATKTSSQLMKTALLLLLLSFNSFSQDKPDIRVEQLKAENEALKAQLAQLTIEFRYEMQVCQAPDLMKARLTAREAEAKKAATDKKEPPK